MENLVLKLFQSLNQSKKTNIMNFVACGKTEQIWMMYMAMFATSDEGDSFDS